LSEAGFGGYVGDLLSDVMANSHEGDIWITRQIHQNTVAVASLKEHAAVIFVNGSEPTAETGVQGWNKRGFRCWCRVCRALKWSAGYTR